MEDKKDILNTNLLVIYKSFERIGKALELRWGDKEFQPYMNSLLGVGRPSRQGFPIDVLEALINLQQLHDTIFPEYVIHDPNNWSSMKSGI